MLKRNIQMLAALAVMLLTAAGAQAQNIALKVQSFVIDNTDRTAWEEGTAMTFQKNGQTHYYPIVKVRIANERLGFEGKTVKTELQETGEYWVYMEEGAKSLKVTDLTGRKEPVNVTFSSYSIPALRSRGTYILTLKFEEGPKDFYTKKSSFIIGLGVNATSVFGPMLTLGFDIHHFNVEGYLVLGTNESDEVTFPATNQYSSDVTSSFTPVLLGVRLGYDLKLSKKFGATPQVGFVRTYADPEYSSSEVKDGTAYSATLGLRLFWCPFGRGFRIQATPQYNLLVSKDDGFKTISDADANIKKWANGFNLNVGLLYYF